jgi:SAM-dependent methyltransferase
MNFDRLAPHYDRLEAITAGERLQRARTAWLDELSGRRRILSAGEGHGRFAAACAARFPAADLTCVEASPAMLARAQARTPGRSGRLHWQLADLRDWTPPAEKFDAIVTCFFLDCFPPETLAAIIAKLAGCAAPDAVWLIADFAVPAHGPARWRARAVHALMYAFFRTIVGLPARHLTPPDHLLRAEGFALAGRRESEWGLLRTDVWRRR